MQPSSTGVRERGRLGFLHFFLWSAFQKVCRDVPIQHVLNLISVMPGSLGKAE